MFSWLKKRGDAPQAPLATEKTASPPKARFLSPREEGDRLLAADDLAGAAPFYLQAVADNPQDSAALTSLGFAQARLGEVADALRHLRQSLALDASQPDAHYVLGRLYEQADNTVLAISHWQKAIALSPAFDLAARDLTRVLFRAGRADEAREVIAQALTHHPDVADLHDYQGNILAATGDAGGAVESYQRALALDPQRPSTELQRGHALERCGDDSAAADAYGRSIALAPHAAHAHNNLANLRMKSGRLDEAAAGYEAAWSLDPSLAAAAANLGHVYRQQGRLDDALSACERAIAADPALVIAHNNLASTLINLGRPQDALASFLRALALEPDTAGLHANLGHTLNLLGRHEEALAAYTHALARDTHAPWLYGAWLMTRQILCDWQGIDEPYAELARRIDAGEQAATPFTMLAAPLSAAQQLHCAQIYTQGIDLPASTQPAWPAAEASPPRRLRIAYFSADFHDHAAMQLMAGMFERHDRSRFEVIAFSFGPPSNDPMRARVEAAFDRFIDVQALPAADIAARARAMGLDIAIDLKGHTEDSRPAIFAHRAAPLQLSYLGYPGSTGAAFIDYLMADGTVVPPEAEPFYSEKIIALPGSYQVNDDRRALPERDFTRAELGLPDSGFVFCCLNNNYKITPDVFNVWMRLLGTLPGSVLWLLEGTQKSVQNLRTEAGARGVAAERLVFAPRMEGADHFARQRQADLFLDTLNCNAHTTASDALWAGLPVLTFTGQTFASRVATSLVKAAGLPELAVASLGDYEALALALARDPARLAALKQRLQDGRNRCALFDTERSTRHVEEAYLRIWQRHVDGLAPAPVRWPAG